jgi:hypothetical protein
MSSNADEAAIEKVIETLINRVTDGGCGGQDFRLCTM